MTIPRDQRAIVDPGATLGGRTSLRDVLVDAEKRLASAGVPSPATDAAELVAHVLGIPRTRLLLHERMDAADRIRLEQLLVKRVARVPLQHLIGSVGFRHLELRVGPGVFVPRPETELVVEAAVRGLAAMPPAERLAVDLCAGSGAIALALATEVPGSVVHAVEVDPGALVWLRDNVADHEDRLAASGSRVVVHAGDVSTCAAPGGALAPVAGHVAVVASNPPYVPTDAVPRDPEVREHDPALALYGGADGLDIVRGILRTAAILLRPGGLLVVEHGDGQGEDAGPRGIPGLMRDHRVDEDLALEQATPEGFPLWTSVRDRPDLSQRPRLTLATRT